MAHTLGEMDAYLFCEGTHSRAYEALGAHPFIKVDALHWRFAVWAPDAKAVSVVGDFNAWCETTHPLQPHAQGDGFWQGSIADLPQGTAYKYAIRTKAGKWVYRADPFGAYAQHRPDTASRLWDLSGYSWGDDAWLANRTHQNESPMTIYEVHLGSWRRHEDGMPYTYLDLARELPSYVKELGFTHVELMPVSEYPLDDSWGYQVTGYYAVTSRYGTPQQFMQLVDSLHQAGIGVLLDWVPAHFAKDECGLRRFDGSALYEHSDPRRGEQQQWGTMVFDYGKGGVRSFLTSNALFWMDVYHIDGLRVDAVSSMLYLDYGRKAGQWLPNAHGGRENLEAIAFFRHLNHEVGVQFPGVMMMAEEATAYPMVTKPDYVGGLGFHRKWNMGWMNDILSYMEMDSIYRKYHHNKLTFSMMYAFSENYILPLSHDEVVHGKRSLLAKMPGDYAQQFDGMRLLLCYMYAHPGGKLLFMGTELAPFIEWRFYEGLEWHLLEYESHRGMQQYVRALNHFYREQPALWRRDDGWAGFQWLGANDFEHSVIVFMRTDGQQHLVCAFNFTPWHWQDYQIGLPYPGTLSVVFSTHLLQDQPPIAADRGQWNGYACHAQVPIPSLGAVIYAYQPRLPRWQRPLTRPGRYIRKPLISSKANNPEPRQ